MEEKLLCDSKNWYRAETIERCSINRTRLIEYALIRSRVRLEHSKGDRCSGVTLQVKSKGKLIVRLKAIESKEDTFCYLSFYLHRNFLWHFVIIYEIVKPMQRPLVVLSIAIKLSRPWGIIYLVYHLSDACWWWL